MNLLSVLTEYDSEKEATRCLGCGANEGEARKILRFLAVVLALRKRLLQYNLGKQCPPALHSFFTEMLTTALTVYSLVRVDGWSDDILKALQISEQTTSKKKGKADEAQAKPAAESLETSELLWAKLPAHFRNAVKKHAPAIANIFNAKGGRESLGEAVREHITETESVTQLPTKRQRGDETVAVTAGVEADMDTDMSDIDAEGLNVCTTHQQIVKCC